MYLSLNIKIWVDPVAEPELFHNIYYSDNFRCVSDKATRYVPFELKEATISESDYRKIMELYDGIARDD